jgi:hypothetical protein
MASFQYASHEFLITLIISFLVVLLSRLHQEASSSFCTRLMPSFGIFYSNICAWPRCVASMNHVNEVAYRKAAGEADGSCRSSEFSVHAVHHGTWQSWSSLFLSIVFGSYFEILGVFNGKSRREPKGDAGRLT